MAKRYEFVEANEEKIRELEKGSAFTFEGFMKKDANKLIDILEKNKTGIKTPVTIYTWNGELFNTIYGLTDDNAYPNDLTFISIDLNSFTDIGRLAVVKLEIGARWLDDIVDNNAYRQRQIDGTEEDEYDEEDED